jgi:hypothetical protein
MMDLETNNRDDDANSIAEASTSSGTTTNFDSTSNTPKETTQTSSESSTLARAETAAVNRSKMLVLFVLTLAAISVSIATYLFARKSETKEFEEKVRYVEIISLAL